MQTNKATVGGLAKSFLKIGCIGFGGGSALIPIIKQEIVDKKGYMSRDDYIQHTVIASITPGALPVKLGATCGYQLCGLRGSVVGAYATMLPGVFLTVLIVALFSGLGDDGVTYLRYASVGITAFIVFLLIRYIVEVITGGKRKTNLILCIAAFCLTGGKEIRDVIALLLGLGAPRAAIMDISTISLMALTFFIILLYTASDGRRWITATGLIIALLYCAASGKWALTYLPNAFRRALPAVMVIYSLLIFFSSRKKNRKGRSMKPIPESAWLTMAVMLLTAVAVSIPAVVLLGAQSLKFIGQLGLSALTSFGGGEAYVSVADGIFVQGGVIPTDVFYTQLVPAANALPGPILVKIASGMGYIYGSSDSALAGMLAAVSASAVTTSLCSVVAVLLFTVYDIVEDSGFIAALKTYILPIICGMLLSTCCAMLGEGMHVLTSRGFSGPVSLSVLVVFVAALIIIRRRKNVNDLFLLLGSALLSVAGIMLLS